MEENKEFECTHSCASCAGCGHDHEGFEDEMETGIITFVDDEGNDVKFEILDVVTLDEKEYLVVLPVEETESGVLKLSLPMKPIV